MRTIKHKKPKLYIYKKKIPMSCLNLLSIIYILKHNLLVDLRLAIVSI